MATLSQKKGSFAGRATVGNQAITGLGFQPKVVFFWSADSVAHNPDSLTNFGVGVSSSQMWAAGECGFTNGTFPNVCKSYLGDARCTGQRGDTSDKYYAMVSLDADGFTINCVTNLFGDTPTIHYLALGGTAIVNVAAGTMNQNVAGPADQALTGLGFKPNAVIFANGGGGAKNAENSDTQFFIGAQGETTGVGSGSGNGLSPGGVGAVGSTDVNSGSTNDGCGLSYPAYAAVKMTVLATILSGALGTLYVKSYDADGFTLHNDDSGDAIGWMGYVAIQFAANFGMHVVFDTQKTSIGNQALTGAGIHPSAALFFSSGITGVFDASPVPLEWTVGGTDGTNQGYLWGGNVEGNRVNARLNGTDACVVHALPPDTATIKGKASIVSLDSDGYTLNWGTSDGTARTHMALLFGQLPSTTVAVDDSYSTPFETPLIVAAGAGVLANDTNAGTSTVNTSPSHGSLSLNTDGSFTYTPNTGFSGTDTFVYNDVGGSNTATATVTLTVGSAGDPPPSGNWPPLVPSNIGDPGLSGSLAELRMQLEDGRDLTPLWETANFTTLAIGGFGSLEFMLEGWRKPDEVPKLMLVRVTYGPELLWEGRIEDTNYVLADGDVDTPGEQQTAVTCYGLKRLLDDDTERRIWSLRTIGWKVNQAAAGYSMGLETKTKDLDVQTGGFDPTDLTKGGVQIMGGGTAIGTLRGNGAEIILPQGMTAKRIRGIVTLAGANTGTGKLVGLVEWSDAISGSFIWVGTYYRAAGPTAVDEDLSTPASTIIIRLSGVNEAAGSLTPTSADTVSFYNLRILCTSLNEDTTISTVNGTGGFYGGTLIRDIIALVAGLKQGTIEDATEFVIDQLERSVRGPASAMIDEIAQYSTRQWAVWEDGAFDWKSVNFDEPQWIVPVELCDQVDITSSVEGQAKRVVVLYVDPATGLTAEQSSTSTDGRNPFVKYAAARDMLVQRDAMTANTAAQLAAKITQNDVGAYTPASGHVVIPALTLVQSVKGGHGLPACAIRAGCNIVVPGLPKSDPFDTGRDGETLFHVVTSTVDLGQGTVTLELENSTRRTQALLARLTSVTDRLTRF